MLIDLRKVRADHARLLAQHNAAVATELRLAGEAGLAEVHRNPPFKRGTGELQAATDYRIVRRPNGSVIRIRNPKPYAAPIDKGSAPHVIHARRRKALAFLGSGGMVFRRAVNHPGNKPYRFLSTATIAAGRAFELGMARRMRAISRSF
jgi:hypothetical protein